MNVATSPAFSDHPIGRANGPDLLFPGHFTKKSVGDTTFGPVAQGARRQDTKNTEAEARSKRGGGQSSLFFGAEREDRRRPGDASVTSGP